MKLDIDLNAMFVDKIHDEVEDFKAKDAEFRDEIIRSGQVVGITPQISNASTALNNNINFFLSSCRRNGILTPLNTIIANHLCEYLENMYFEGLADSVDAINVSVEKYTGNRAVCQPPYYQYTGNFLKKLRMQL